MLLATNYVAVVGPVAAAAAASCQLLLLRTAATSVCTASRSLVMHGSHIALCMLLLNNQHVCGQAHVAAVQQRSQVQQ